MRQITYIDTSLLVKRYLPEMGSNELEARLLAEQPQLVVSELTGTEIISAFRRKERQGLIERSFANAAHARFLTDLQNNAIQTLPLTSHVVEKASSLLLDLRAPLATLDALHLASALIHGADLFFTSDIQLSRAAQEAGLGVWPDFPVL